MKKQFLIVTWIFICVISLAENTWPDDKQLPKKIIGVREFMKQSDKFSGTVTVKGVVSGIYPEHKMIAIIDIEELKTCKVVTCASFTLPVLWEGDMPKLKETIRITGEIQKKDNKRLFVASDLKKIK